MPILNAGKTLKGLWKEGWVKLPEVMTAHIFSTVAIVVITTLHIFEDERARIIQYYDRPLFLRPDDPRAKRTVTYYKEKWDEK